MLSARDDLHNFEAVTRFKAALGEFGRGNGFAVVFDHNAARQEVLGDQKVPDRAGQRGICSAAIGNYKAAARGWIYGR